MRTPNDLRIIRRTDSVKTSGGGSRPDSHSQGARLPTLPYFLLDGRRRAVGSPPFYFFRSLRVRTHTALPAPHGRRRSRKSGSDSVFTWIPCGVVRRPRGQGGLSLHLSCVSSCLSSCTSGLFSLSVTKRKLSITQS